MYNEGTLTLTGSTRVNDNRSSIGGGVVNEGTLVMDDTSMISLNNKNVGNTAIGSGGGVFNVGTLTMNYSSTISGNRIGAGGGVANDGSLIMNDAATISDNRADSGGGVSSEGSLEMNDESAIHDNRAGIGGGVSNAGVVTMNDSSSIHDNRARDFYDDGSGGGVSNEGTLTMNGAASIHQNDAGLEGGGVHNDANLAVHGTLTMNDSASIHGNTAGGSAGVLNLGTISMSESSSIHDNSAETDGGGLVDINGTLAGVICPPEAGANVRSNTPDDCYIFGEQVPPESEDPVALEEPGAIAHAEQRMDGDATAGARRIERPDDGFALTFAVDWDVDITDEWHTAEVGSGAAEFREVLVGWREPNEYCAILDLDRIAGSPPRWTSLDDATSWASDWATRQDTTVDQPAFSDLLAGEAASVDIHYDDGWEMTDFVFVHSDRWFLLQCGAEDPPTDRWLSIAETFEFLPAEE